MRHGAELDADFRSLAGHALARAQIEWHILPAPVVHEQPQRRVGFGLGIGRHAVFLAVPAQFLWRNGPDRVKNVDFLVANLVGVERHHRLHRHQAEQLQQVVLHHVAQRARAIVITAAMFHAHFFGHRDGHVVHIAPVPNRLEQRVGEPERQDVLHGFLAQVMIDPENLSFVKGTGESAVQRHCERKVVPDGLFDDQSRPFPVRRQAGIVQEGGNLAEQEGRGSHVENALGFGSPLRFQLLAQAVEFRVGRVALEIPLQVADMLGDIVPLLGRDSPAA